MKMKIGITKATGQLATEISRHSGKLIPFKNLGEGEYAEALKKSFDFPDEIAQVLAGMDVAVVMDGTVAEAV